MNSTLERLKRQVDAACDLPLDAIKPDEAYRVHRHCQFTFMIGDFLILDMVQTPYNPSEYQVKPFTLKEIAEMEKRGNGP